MGILTEEMNGTVMDYYLFCMRGMPVFHFDPVESFSIPIYWFVFQITAAYFTAYYAHNDFMENGRNLFIASGNRTSWWRGKYLWCMISVIVYFLVTVLAVAVSAMCFGAELSYRFTEEFMTAVFLPEMVKLTGIEAILISFLLPLVITMALCMVQLLLSFLLTPVVSFAVSCAVYVLSAYYTSWFFMGNYTMWLRSSYVTAEGISSAAGLVMGVTVILLTCAAGRLYFEKKDIF